jgi:hypothetical protein
MDPRASLRNSVIATLAISSLLGIGMLYLRHSPGRAAGPAAAQTAKPALESSSLGTVLPRHLSPQLSSAPVLLSSTPQQQSPFQPSAGQTPLDAMRDRVMTSHPDLAQFRFLQRKVLLSPEEKETLRAIYKDPEMLEAAKLDLLAEGEKTLSEDRQFQRLYRVEYLGMALEWTDNPNRTSVLDSIKELILAKNIHRDQELELRRSLAGDKVEMFMILLNSERAMAEALLEEVRGSELEKLLSYARARFDSLQKLAVNG